MASYREEKSIMVILVRKKSEEPLTLEPRMADGSKVKPWRSLVGR